MKSICFVFDIHLPFKLREYRFFDIGSFHDYYDDYQNKYTLKRIAERSYLPMNNLLLDLIHQNGKKFKVSFVISGTTLTQMQWYYPEVLESFQTLAATGQVEFLATVDNHGLSSIEQKEEFKAQVLENIRKIKECFGKTPNVFCNTDLIYSDEIGKLISSLGFKAMFTEGARHVLGWKSPNYVYENALHSKMKLLLRNAGLSEDLSLRFSDRTWMGWPLTSERFVQNLLDLDEKDKIVNFYMDYATFGEYQGFETGIFDFFKLIPASLLATSKFNFATPSEIIINQSSVSALHVPHPISCIDDEKDITPYLGNDMQSDAFHTLAICEEKIKNCKDVELLKDWSFLQSSDHFYYMSTKWFAGQTSPKYIRPYDSPYDAFINYMNILTDFSKRLENYYMNTKITNEKKKTMAKLTPKAAAVKPAAKKVAPKAAAVKPAAKKVAPKAAAKPAAKKVAPKAAVKPAAKKVAPKAAVKPAAKKVAPKAAVKPAAKKVAPKAAVKPAAKKVAPKAAVKPAAKKAAPKAAAKPAAKKAAPKAAAKPAAKKVAPKAAVKPVAKKTTKK